MFNDAYKYLTKNDKITAKIRFLSIVKTIFWMLLMLEGFLNFIFQIAGIEVYKNLAMSVFYFSAMLFALVGIFVFWFLQHIMIKKELENDCNYQSNDEIDNAFLLYRKAYRESKIKISKYTKKSAILYILCGIFLIVGTIFLCISGYFKIKLVYLGIALMILSFILFLFTIIKREIKAENFYHELIASNNENIKIIINSKSASNSKFYSKYSPLEDTSPEQQLKYAVPNEKIFEEIRKIEKINVKFLILITIIFPIIFLSLMVGLPMFDVVSISVALGWGLPVSMLILFVAFQIDTIIFASKTKKLLDAQYKEFLLDKDKYINEIKLHDKRREFETKNKKNQYYIYALLVLIFLIGIVVICTKISPLFNLISLGAFVLYVIVKGFFYSKIIQKQRDILRTIEEDIQKTIDEEIDRLEKMDVGETKTEIVQKNIDDDIFF